MSIFILNKKASGSKARTGHVFLKHGVVQTPVFMPIGTIGSVKGLTNWELEKLNFEIILGNTYHLWLAPDLEILKKVGGLHQFNSWNRPMLTDSGGFQAFSLSAIRTFDENGVTFKVPKNGQKRFLSPEVSMGIQTVLGSDIALVLDECLPADVSQETARSAMERTFRWAKRGQDEWHKLQTNKKKLESQSRNLDQNVQVDNLSERNLTDVDSPNFNPTKKIYKPNYQKIVDELREKFNSNNLKKVVGR